jgi:hypothetical protein
MITLQVRLFVGSADYAAAAIGAQPIEKSIQPVHAVHVISRIIVRAIIAQGWLIR